MNLLNFQPSNHQIQTGRKTLAEREANVLPRINTVELYLTRRLRICFTLVCGAPRESSCCRLPSPLENTLIPPASEPSQNVHDDFFATVVTDRLLHSEITFLANSICSLD